MKRKISLLLVLGLVLTSLVACKAPKKDEVSDKAPNNEVEDENEETSIRVQVEKGSKNHYEKAANRVKEQYPDTNIEFIETTSKDHLDLLGEKDSKDEEIADIFTISLDDLYSLEEKHQAYPMNIKTLVNFINVKNAEANDINTIKDIEFTELSNEDILIPIFDTWYGIAFMNAGKIELLTEMESGEFYSDMTRDFSELNVNQEEIFKAMYNYWYYSQEEESLLFSKEEYLAFMDDSFKTGGVTSIRPGDINARDYLSEIAGGNIDILPIESLVVMGNSLSQWKDGDRLAINARIKDHKDKMEIAEAMVEEIVNPEYAIDLFKDTGKILQDISLETYTKSDLDDRDKDFIKAAYLSYEKAIDPPVSKEWQRVADTWEKAILSWNSLKPTTVEEAYKILQDEFKDMLNSIN